MRFFKFVLLLGLIGVCLFGYFYKGAGSFFIEFVKEPGMTGSVAPSSDGVCEDLLSDLPKLKRPLRILEVGAGTGVITELVVAALQEGDRFDVVEINSDLCEKLKTKYTSDRVSVHCMSILDYRCDCTYDLIITTLPFNAFPPSDVREILGVIASLRAPKGRMSYIEYMGTRYRMRFLGTYDEEQKLAQVQQAMVDFKKQYAETVEIHSIWFNIPPTYVYHIQFK